MRCPQCGRDNLVEARFCMSCGTDLAARDATTPAGTATDIGLSPDFVGRHREVDELVRVLGDALEGRGRLVMLAGEPGIGKTRTAQELVYYAEARGAKVLWASFRKPTPRPKPH